MKTIKISLSILAFSLALVSFAQFDTDNPLAYAESADMLYESDMEMEAWMYVPFEAEIHEEALVLEEWMTTSFTDELAEKAMVLEAWMTTPFDTPVEEEKLEMEEWMNAPFFAIR